MARESVVDLNFTQRQYWQIKDDIPMASIDLFSGYIQGMGENALYEKMNLTNKLLNEMEKVMHFDGRSWERCNCKITWSEELIDSLNPDHFQIESREENDVSITFLWNRTY